MKSIVIKAAAPADVETLVSLRLEMRREREEVPLQVAEAEFEAALREFFAETIAAGTFVSFIAWDGETAAACSGLSLEVQPPSYGNLSGRVGYVTNMYTRPAYRGQGLAWKLLDALKDYAVKAGCGKMELNASDAGYPVYQKYGFKDVKGQMKLVL